MNILDSRDLQKELDEIQPQVEEWTAIVNAHEEEERMDEYPGLEIIGRCGELEALADECSNSGWSFGIMFIPKDRWRDYAEEFAYDIGEVERDSAISGYIDWEKYADDMRIDYAETDIGGVTYYWRES